MNKADIVFPFLMTLVLCAAVVACVSPTVTPTTSPPVTPPPSVLPSPTISPLEKPLQDSGVVRVRLVEEGNSMNDFLQALMDFCMSAGLPTILALCVVDIGFGVGSALKAKAFDWRKVGDFYVSQVLSLVVPYVATLAALALVPGLAEFLPAVAAPAGLLAGILAKLAGSIIANAGKLTGS